MLAVDPREENAWRIFFSNTGKFLRRFCRRASGIGSGDRPLNARSFPGPSMHLFDLKGKVSRRLWALPEPVVLHHHQAGITHWGGRARFGLPPSCRSIAWFSADCRMRENQAGLPT